MVRILLITSLIISIISIIISKLGIIISIVSVIVNIMNINIHGSAPLTKQEILGMPTMYKKATVPHHASRVTRGYITRAAKLPSAALNCKGNR